MLKAFNDLLTTGQKIGFWGSFFLNIGLFITFIVSLFIATMNSWLWLGLWLGSTVISGIVAVVIYRKVWADLINGDGPAIC